MLQEKNARQGFFERAEFDAILKHLPAYMHPPMEFMYTTGWRPSEVYGLSSDRVDLKARTVSLHVGTTKNSEGRTFYMTDGLHRLLTKHLESLDALKKSGTISTAVFHRPDGSILKTNGRDEWNKAKVAAGLPNKIQYDCRRTAVRSLERASVPRTSSMKMVGHKTESIYRRYAIQDEVMLREAAAKLEAWTTAQTPTPPKGQLAAFPTAETTTVKERRKSARTA